MFNDVHAWLGEMGTYKVENLPSFFQQDHFSTRVFSEPEGSERTIPDIEVELLF